MKKISVLILSSLFALTLFASGRQPLVTINTSNDYEVMINGTYYRGNNTIPNLSQGTHSVQVYQTKRGLLGKRRTLVTTSSFQLNNNDVSIFVDSNGQLRINESGNNNNNNNNNTGNGNSNDNNDWNNKNKNENHNNGHNNGRGKKKGHQKHHN